MNYKASIIIPCYNKEKYLHRALNSIVSLSRFEDFEVIIVDDHSSDDSVGIIKEYVAKYDSIRLIEQEKGSGSASRPRNIGIAESDSEYLIFMDPDDYIINDGYSIFLDKIEEYDSDIVIGTRIGVTPSGQKAFTDFIDERFTYINSNDYEIKYDLLYRPPFILKTIYRRDLIVDNHITFNEKISTSEDESFDMMCASYAKKITKVNDIVYCYTVEAPGSTTTEVSLKMYRELYDIICELEKAYSIGFSKTVVMEKIATLVCGFYTGRIAFFNSSDDIDEAFRLMQNAIQKFGYEKFRAMENENLRKRIDEINNGDFQHLVQKSFLRRTKALENRLKVTEKKLRKSKKEIKKIKSIQNRKTVKAAIKVSKAISSTKNKIFKES